MKPLLEKLKAVDTEGCVSIIFNTHRTSPESQQDVIKLKNLVKEAETTLAETFPAQSQAVLAVLNDFKEEIDHLYNLDSMAIFVNPDMIEVVRLEVPVQDRVVVDRKFVLRDLIRALNESAHYYVLVLSRRKARLIEAFNGQVINDEMDGFPIENGIIEIDPHRLTMAAGTDNLIENFFKHVDNEVVRVVNQKRLPIVIATEERNFHHYLKVSVLRDLIVGHLPRNRDEEEARLIVQDCWPLVHDKVVESNEVRVHDLLKGNSVGQVMSDLNDISRAINSGQGRTLFVRKGLYQPGFVLGERIEIASESAEDVHADILEELITGSVNHGGDVVFLESRELDEFDGVALLTRY